MLLPALETLDLGIPALSAYGTIGVRPREEPMIRLFAALTLLLSPLSALAARPTCPTPAHEARLHAFGAELAGAESPEAAKEMALAKIALGHQAIDRVARVLPNDEGIADAEARLDAFEAGVLAADSQREVAAQFDQLALLGSCQYDTVEIAIIVIGFILGILPGILFLFLFC
jgi:hypothetical protein